MTTTILLATDGSPSASAATAKAIELAQATGWALHAVTVWHTPISGYGIFAAAYAPELGELERERAGEILGAVEIAAEDAGVELTTEMREGYAPEEICEAAKECGAGLIVIGSHGWGPIRRLVVGSVSSAVLDHVHVPVLIVRGEAARHDKVPAAAGAESAKS
jgi:nucleotide-binding universal stress UspA family protein